MRLRGAKSALLGGGHTGPERSMGRRGCRNRGDIMDRHKLGKLIPTSLAWPSGGRITAASTAGGLPRVVGEPAVLQGESMDAARRQLPIAYAVGGGAAGGVVLDARQSEEFILTVRRRWLGVSRCSSMCGLRIRTRSFYSVCS